MKVEPRTKAIVALMLILIVGTVVGLVVAKASLNFIKSKLQEQGKLGEKTRYAWHAFEGTFIIGMVVVLTNLALLSGLLWIYLKSYLETRSNFMLGLIIFLSVLVVQTALTLPILHVSIGTILYHARIATILPNLFEMIALIILFLLSTE